MKAKLLKIFPLSIGALFLLVFAMLVSVSTYNNQPSQRVSKNFIWQFAGNEYHNCFTNTEYDLSKGAKLAYYPEDLILKVRQIYAVPGGATLSFDTKHVRSSTFFRPEEMEFYPADAYTAAFMKSADCDAGKRLTSQFDS